MTYMTDTARAAALLNFAFNGTTTPFTSAPTQPFMLKMMTAPGAGNGNVSGSNGTEATSSNSPGYTAGGKTLGASAPFGTFSTTAPSGSNANSVTWSASGTWTAPITGIEIWDSSGTSLRWLQGALTANITGVVNGDSVQFASAAITANAAAW